MAVSGEMRQALGGCLAEHTPDFDLEADALDGVTLILRNVENESAGLDVHGQRSQQGMV